MTTTLIRGLLKGYTLAILSCAALTMASVPAYAQVPGQVANPYAVRVTLLGDTLTSGYQLRPGEGFCPMLERYAQQKGMRVAMNCIIFPRESVREAYLRINEVIAERPDIVVIALGSNDALAGIPAGETYQALHSIVYMLEKAQIKLILAGVAPPSNMTKSQAGVFTKGYFLIAKERKHPLHADILGGILGHEKLLLADKYHPNADGVKVMVVKFWNIIGPFIQWKYNTMKYESEMNK